MSTAGHSLFLLNDDTVYSCGDNAYKMLGRTTGSTYTTIVIPTLSNVKSLWDKYNIQISLISASVLNVTPTHMRSALI